MYSNIPLKKIKKDLGPLISFLLVTSRIVMKHARIDLKWHKHSPIFSNFALLIGNAPVSFPQWKDKEVHILTYLYDDNGLRAFNDLQAEYGLPAKSFFSYLQLRSSLKAYGVPWGVPLLTHPLHKLLASQQQTRGMVSKLYKFISAPCTLLVESVWCRDISSMGEEEICWDRVGENLRDTSKNPDHQLIHFK